LPSWPPVIFFRPSSAADSLRLWFSEVSRRFFGIVSPVCLMIRSTAFFTAVEPVDVEGQVAPLPTGGSEPSEAQCLTQLQKNQVSELDLARDVAFCAQTGDGRTAYLRVISAPVEGEGKVRLKVTVWDLPQ
jgi:hypothetical protein